MKINVCQYKVIISLLMIVNICILPEVFKGLAIFILYEKQLLRTVLMHKTEPSSNSNHSLYLFLLFSLVNLYKFG